MTETAAAAMAMLAVMAGMMASAEEEIDLQEQEMLEFLGSWETEDEDWLAMNIEDIAIEQEQAETGDERGAEAANDER